MTATASANLHMPNQPPPWWATLILGFILGLLGDPVKKFISERYERRRATRELYDDLGSVLGARRDLND